MAGKAKEEQSLREGTYILSDSLVNGYPHWLKTDGSQAIWFDKVSSGWLVYKKGFLGSKYGGIGGPKGKDSYPNEIKQGWKYGDSTVGGPVDAGPDDVIFKTIGTVFKSLFYNMKHVSNSICDCVGD